MNQHRDFKAMVNVKKPPRVKANELTAFDKVLIKYCKANRIKPPPYSNFDWAFNV